MTVPATMLVSKITQNRRGRRRKAAISSVIGGVLILAIIFSVGYGYFYSVSQDQQSLQKIQKQNASFLSLKNEESAYIVANVSSFGNFTFTVTNTGIPITLVAYFINDQTGKIWATEKGPGNATSPPSCPLATSFFLVCELNPGVSTTFIPRPQVTYITGSVYTFKVLTNRGTTITGTYPTEQLTSSALTSLVASGLGSLEMVFRSFTFYGYTGSNPCVSPNPCNINLTSAQSGAITPFNRPIAFSAQVTNDDPSGGTIVVDSHTDLWTFLSCGSGCGTQAFLSFYVMNVASNGTVLSKSYGSYVPLQIAYGQTKTVYFGSSCDLSVSSCSYGTQSVSDNIGEHDVFMIFSGTLISPTNSTLYSQNLPFAATFTSDNIASFSETPTTCGNGSSTTFNLQVTNSNWSPSGDGINKVIVQAASFNPPTSGQPATPTGWTINVNSGTITWSASSSAYYIQPGKSLSFGWIGTAPVVHNGTQYTFVSSVNWNSGTIQSQPIGPGCYVG